MDKLICKNFSEFRANEGQSLPTGNWLLVTQKMIDAFAEATLDFQWVHVDHERIKKESPFKKPIAHGFLSVSLLSKMLMDLIVVDSMTMGVNYGLNKVRFPNPVLVDSKVRLHSSIAKIEEYGKNGLKITWNCSVEIENTEKPACVAEFVSLMFE
ncbi:MaoC family dehydratase [Aquimarina sp. AD10]|uniref:Dehydratase n=1 Tax=Aquimarina aggregata TaxID=1642818 RepID=A0A162DL24_9FLAO|nr:MULTISPECIES: MaoC family dehydratase [Aquimarina]AXT59982.1 MaoC family dehydratase [Aquimarina sp. AD10]KZS42028.1 dehydratase [Aquimarina aggregata]RKM93818.1 MaoC family dehydratase [Aquimarina sp. AD10]